MIHYWDASGKESTYNTVDDLINNNHMKQLTKQQARKEYQEGSECVKAFIINVLGFSKEEMEQKDLPTNWDQLGSVDGWFVSEIAKVYSYLGATTGTHKNLFATEAQAKASIAMAQLTQLMKAYNGGNQEDWCDWNDEDQDKYALFFYNNEIDFGTNSCGNFFLAFKTAELRDHFLEHHIDLIEQAKPLLG